MANIKFNIKGKVNEKKFRNKYEALRFLKAKNYEYDEIEGYYWNVNLQFGWITKAFLKES